MMATIDPRALMSFRAVAMHGSFAAAARELGWTQPALSQHVTRLEEQLGATLVKRTVKGVQLTETGMRLLHHADLIDGHLERASREISGMTNGGAHTVRLLAFPSACISIVAPAMSELLAKPGGQGALVELEQREPYEVPEAFRRGTADIAIVFRYENEDLPSIEEDFTASIIGWDPLQLIVSKRQASASRQHVSRLLDHADDRWVAGCPTCRQHFLRIAHREGFAPDIRHATDDLMVVQELVARDMSVSVVPRLSLESYRQPGIRAFGLQDGDGRELMILMAKDESRPEVHEVARALTRAASSVLDPR